MKRPLSALPRAALLLIFVFGMSSHASAQLLVPVQLDAPDRQFILSPVLSFVDIDYDLDSGGTVGVDRTILGVSGVYGMNRQVDFYGELGYIVESELESGGDDDGFQLGGGVKGLFFERDQISLMGLAGVRFITESYGGGTDGQFFEVPLALVLRGKVNREFSVYGGIDVIPWSDGEIDGRGGDTDLDRDDPVGLRAGIDYKLEQVVLNAEFSLVSEESFLLRVGIPM